MIRLLEEVNNYAITNHTSRYSEDGLTAQTLLMKSAKKVRECITLVSSLAEGYKNLFINTATEYNADGEELTIVNKITILKKAVDHYTNKFYFLFAENSKSLIELGGNINLAINESLNLISNILLDLPDWDGKEDVIKDLKTQLDNCYIDVYDECSYTLLELGSNTATHVNEFIKTVNMFEQVTDVINGLLLPADYTDETLTNSLAIGEDEIIII